MFYLKAFRMAGELIVLALAIPAFLEAEEKGRVFIASTYGLSLLLPYIFPHPAFSTVCWGARLFLGLGSYIYLKTRGYFQR